VIRRAPLETPQGFAVDERGEIPPMTGLRTSSRHDSLTHRAETATAVAAHAVLGVRVEIGEPGDR
jgi:hypothetical protein